ADHRRNQPDGAVGESALKKGGSAWVLVVDPVSAVRRHLVELLEERGFRVIQADRLDRGLEALNERPVGMIWTELVLPDLEGAGVVEAFRRGAGGAEVLICSSLADRK